jgi:peroxiredoxin
VKRGAIAIALVAACHAQAPPPEVATLPDITPLEAGAPVAPAPPRPPERITDGTLTEGDPVGQRAPGFDLAPSVGTKRVALYRGRVTLVYFWATWCAPCARAFPELAELHEKYAARGFDLAAISVDDEDSPKEIRDFATRYKGTFPIAHDKDHDVSKRYMPKMMPSHYIVDREGFIQHVHEGYHDGEVAQMEGEIRRLL